MKGIEVRDMQEADEVFVGTCTHVDESDEIDRNARERLAWLRGRQEAGLRVKVADLDGEQAGFLYVMPIEMSPWGPLGHDLLVFPCMFVLPSAAGRGVGSALIAAAEEEVHRQGRKGLVTMGYHHDFWFMPAAFFERRGFVEARRAGRTVILWKVVDPSAEAPHLLDPEDRFELVPGRVVVDLFWNRFCQTSNIESQRVREVAQEFGEAVVLREYDACDPGTLQRYQRARGIFVDGEEIGWGYTAPREGIREAIAKALAGAREG